MKTIRFRDTVKIDSKTKHATIMRDGTYIYLAGEIGADEYEPTKRLVVYRPKEEVKKAYNRFVQLGKVPVIYNHPDGELDLSDPKAYAQGYGTSPHMTTDSGGNNNIACTLQLMGDALEAYQNGGVREISCGWSGTYEKSLDERYDYIQRFTDFNHIALVPEGRCGSTCSVQDSKLNKGERRMSWFKAKKKAVKDEDINPSTGAEEQMHDAEQCVGAIKDFIENPNEEHKEAALQALEGLTRFLQAEAKEGEPAPTTDAEEDPKECADEEVEEEKMTKEEVEKKVGDAKAEVLKRYHDVLPFIANGTIAVSEIKDNMTPCDIKAAILKKQTGVAPKENLDAAFKDFQDSFNHPSWRASKPVAKEITDAAVAEIDNIGVKQKGE